MHADLLIKFIHSFINFCHFFSQFDLSHCWAQLLLKLLVPCERNSSYNFIPILLNFTAVFVKD